MGRGVGFREHTERQRGRESRGGRDRVFGGNRGKSVWGRRQRGRRVESPSSDNFATRRHKADSPGSSRHHISSASLSGSHFFIWLPRRYPVQTDASASERPRYASSTTSPPTRSSRACPSLASRVPRAGRVGGVSQAIQAQAGALGNLRDLLHEESHREVDRIAVGLEREHREAEPAAPVEDRGGE